MTKIIQIACCEAGLGRILYALGDDGSIWRLTDGLEPWEQVALPPPLQQVAQKAEIMAKNFANAAA